MNAFKRPADRVLRVTDRTVWIRIGARVGSDRDDASKDQVVVPPDLADPEAAALSSEASDSPSDSSSVSSSSETDSDSSLDSPGTSVGTENWSPCSDPTCCPSVDTLRGQLEVANSRLAAQATVIRSLRHEVELMQAANSDLQAALQRATVKRPRYL